MTPRERPERTVGDSSVFRVTGSARLRVEGGWMVGALRHACEQHPRRLKALGIVRSCYTNLMFVDLWVIDTMTLLHGSMSVDPGMWRDLRESGVVGCTIAFALMMCVDSKQLTALQAAHAVGGPDAVQEALRTWARMNRYRNAAKVYPKNVTRFISSETVAKWTHINAADTSVTGAGRS